ncbi:MAG: hypothetical protein EOP60_06245 [Sphingomonadales bacterium]|nr:MAG: hypothetical protein EOP60_06245 [Sphingomonadales bacterium]
MKILGIVAAAAAAMLFVPAASAAPVSAPASPITASAIAESGQVRVVVREDRRRHRGWNRGHRRAAWRRVCTNRWRNGRSVRICRNVRARR